MRVCHITSGHGPQDGRIFKKMIMSLASKYEVVEIAPNVADSRINGIAIYGVSVPGNKIKKIFRLHAFYKKALDINADVYHIHEPELIPVALRLKKRGKKIVYDSHEDTPMQILGMQWLPKILRKPFSIIFSYYEKICLPSFDAVISVTPSIVNRLRKYNNNTHMITNFPIVKEFKDKRLWGRSVSFAGGISSQWMHEQILNVILKADVKYLLAGKGSHNYMNHLKSHVGWKNVIYKGTIPFTSVIDMTQESSAGMALNDYVANVGYREGSLGNTKLFEYMMAGIPVIATNFNVWQDIIKKYDCGTCVNPHDEKEILNAIMYYLNNPDIAKEKGDNGRKAILTEYNWESQEPILFEIYKNLQK